MPSPDSTSDRSSGTPALSDEKSLSRPHSTELNGRPLNQVQHELIVEPKRRHTADGHMPPLGSLNGLKENVSPSHDSATTSMTSQQQLPPACGARQLSKLKRFLTTLQQFADDTSVEVGDRVRVLVLDLLNNHLTVEEFHSKLQETTNFPLRPFVVPFLKANLPLLQRELMHCARLARLSPNQFLTRNQQFPYETKESQKEVNGNGKRPTPPRTLDEAIDLTPPASKRRHTNGPPSSHGAMISPSRLDDFGLPAPRRERDLVDRIERERAANGLGFSSTDLLDHHPLDRWDDDWRHADMLLSYVTSMNERLKRVICTLQQRHQRDREDLALWMRRVATDEKRIPDISLNMVKQTEERITEVRCRAEEAVNEVKRQAVVELQKAVSAAEHKANELIADERASMRQKIKDELAAQLQIDSEENCWNCGREASETCSGCGKARYCGQFCQHKDWEQHSSSCGSLSADVKKEKSDGKETSISEEGSGKVLSKLKTDSDLVGSKRKSKTLNP